MINEVGVVVEVDMVIECGCKSYIVLIGGRV